MMNSSPRSLPVCGRLDRSFVRNGDLDALSTDVVTAGPTQALNFAFFCLDNRITVRSLFQKSGKRPI